MAQPTLQLTTAELRQEIQRALGYNSSYQGLHRSEQDDVDRCVKRGLRQFYNPPILPGESVVHQWSFLVARGTITTVVDDDSYQLPENFAREFGPLTWPANNWHAPVQIVTDVELRRLAAAGAAVSGVPQYAAITPEATSGDSPNTTPDTPTRYQVTLWPTPSAVYTLTYQYYVVQDVATSSQNPPGGALHGETIIASCLAVVEEILNSRGAQRPGTVYRDRFYERLRSSVALDRKTGGPSTLGFNNDNSDGPYCVRERANVTYNGVQY